MGRMHEKREEEEDDDVGARLTGWRARRGRKCLDGWRVEKVGGQLGDMAKVC